jgi:tRNA (cytidine/uridine-2'-O-)-methyltransferase
MNRRSASAVTSPLLHLVLDRPRIAGNVGAVARLAANVGAAVHVCGPTPFDDADPQLRRSGLDYWADARVHFHGDLARCLEVIGPVRWVVEVGGEKAPWDAELARGDVVLFGPEDGSVPQAQLADRARLLTLPTRAGARSLNLAQCASAVSFEAVRQLGL